MYRTAETPTASTVPEPHGKPGGGLWGIKGLKAPAYIEHVAGELMKQGHDESSAYHMAVGIVENWAAGHDGHGRKVHPDVQAAAAKNIAEWEKLRAQAHGSRGSFAVDTYRAQISTADQNDLPDSAFAYIEDGGEKDESGKTTPRSKRHFPVHDEKHARLAVQMLPTSPFGPKAKGKIMAAAKKYGIETASDDGKAGKGAQVAPDGGTVDTATQGSDADAEMAKAVADAVTEATRPVLDRLAAKETELDGLLAKVKATPIPGGPVLSAAALGTRAALAGDEDHAAKAAYYADRAETVDDPKLAAGYRKLASQAAEKAGITTAP